MPAPDNADSRRLLAAVNQWDQTRPWYNGLDDVVGGIVDPLVANGDDPAVVKGDHIEVDPAFWDQAKPAARRAALYAALTAAGFTATPR